MSSRRCVTGCCEIITETYTPVYEDYRNRFKKLKAGVFMYNPNTKKILLVQSKGEKWGPPKGTMEETDSCLQECAVRELREETGISIDKNTLTTSYKISRATYYIVETDVETSFNLSELDVSGIAWIHPECVKTEQLPLNSHCKRLLSRYCHHNE